MSSDLYASLNGVRAVSASVTVPFYGIPVADVVLSDAPASLTNPCTLVLGNLTVACSIVRTDTFSGTRSVRLVGGAGGWRQFIPAQAYQNPTGIKLSLVLGDVAALVGETVNVPASSDGVIGTNCVLENSQAQRVLRQFSGNLWWVDLKGVTQIIPRTSTKITSAFLVSKYTPAQGKASIATEDLASWMPANTFTNPLLGSTLTISSSRFSADPKGTLRVEVLTAP